MTDMEVREATWACDGSVTTVKFDPIGEFLMAREGHDEPVKVWVFKHPTRKTVQQSFRDGSKLYVRDAPDGKTFGDWQVLEAEPARPE